MSLRKIVKGYPFRSGMSDFKFEMNLSYKLAELVATYAEQKPTLIFCNSRRSVQFTAGILVRDTKYQMQWRQKQVGKRIPN